MLQHCQVVVLQEDIGSAFEINTISFVYSHSEPYSYVKNFSLSMVHVESDQLTQTFTANYEPGSLMEVYHTDSLSLFGAIGDELLIELDSPFQYNGQENLLIDIYYPEGNCYSSVYNWEAGSARSLVDHFLPSGSGSSTGDLYEWVPYMVLEGTQSLDQCTFAAIKIEFGRQQQ